MRKLEAENFQYPFKERETPFQFAYKSMGQEELAKEHTYSIMATEGRMDSFNHFMVGKFMKTNAAPDRLRALGYDLESVLNDAQASTPPTMVDIGGGRGEMILDFKAAFPQLQTSDLIVQEFNHDITDIPELCGTTRTKVPNRSRARLSTIWRTSFTISQTWKLCAC